MEILQPVEWKRPSGYSNGVMASGDMIFVAGQIGWNKDQDIVSDDLVAQIRQALINVKRVLAEGGAGPADVVRMTWYVVDLASYRAALGEIGEVYSSVMGRHYPAMSLVQVSGLLEVHAKVEIEATAVIPS